MGLGKTLQVIIFERFVCNALINVYRHCRFLHTSKNTFKVRDYCRVSDGSINQLFKVQSCRTPIWSYAPCRSCLRGKLCVSRFVECDPMFDRWHFTRRLRVGCRHSAFFDSMAHRQKESVSKMVFEMKKSSLTSASLPMRLLSLKIAGSKHGDGHIAF